ncbi:MAG: FHA domain-containing protein [Gemmataceae bacterium]|nr:FHA domain-containing protein [Gemmataceae bacterium]MDW8266643.1 FHA domain-containing protein [Gemmataceae bacterium]
MSFRLFIWYCAMCGGWAAFFAWALVQFLKIDPDHVASPVLRASFIAAILGLMLATSIGLLDALMNSSGVQRLARVGLCLGVGLIGGLVGGFMGEMLRKAFTVRFLGWILVGAVIGSSIGIFDILRALSAQQSVRLAIRKVVNGVIGGTVGGAIGGVLFDTLMNIPLPWELPKSSLAVGLVILGMCIGLLIGLAQVILKEASIKVEAGFRPGREMILSKPDTTVGRAESCDIGLFGDAGVEKLHARILLKGDRYVLVDNGTPGGTFVNGNRIDGPTPLRSGDLISLGQKSKLRFTERQKRAR